MIAILLPILNALLGGVLKPFVAHWADFERARLVAGEKGFEAAAASDSAVMQQALKADIELNALKMQIYGRPINRVIMIVAGIPPAVHFGLVFVDTVLASKFLFGSPGPLGVPKLPAPYDAFEWAIVSSFFLVHAVTLGKSNVSAWLGRKGA